MGNRTVSVDLQLKAAGFVAGAKEAEKATGQLNDELDGVAKHGRDFDEAVADADKLTVAMKETSREVDKTGTQMKETAVDARFLADELAKARDKALELAAVFSDTGSKTDLSAYKKQARYVSDLERLLKAITPGGSGADSSATAAVAQTGSKLGTQLGLSAGQDFGSAFSGVLSNPVVWAAALPALVDVGAMVGGAVLTGIGLAGIGAGIAGQIHDPRVMAAAARLAADVMNGFRTATSAFGQPVADVLFAARAEWIKLSVGLHTTFDYLAPEVRTLGAGLIGFVDALVPGLERAAVAAIPLVDTFSHWLPQAGSEFADLLNTMADNAGALNDGLKLTLGLVSGIVKLLDYATATGSKAFQFGEATTGTLDWLIHINDSGTKAFKVLDQTKNSTQDAAAAAAAGAPSFDELAKSLNNVALTGDIMAGKLTDKVFSALVAGDEASLHLAESQTRLADAFKQNGRQLDIHTAKGQANREAILAVVQANIKMYDTMIEAGYSADQAAQSYDQNTAALEKQLQKAGLTKDQINGLIGEYRKVPDKVDTSIAMNGLAGAINDLNDLLRLINGLPPRKTVVIEEQHHVTGKITAQRWGGVHYAADGLLNLSGAGVYSGGPLYGFAEPQTGGEAFVPRYGDVGRSTSILSEAAGWYGLSVGRAMPMQAVHGMAGGNLTITLTGADAATRAFVGGLRAHIQGSYGGNVQLALGQ